MPSKKSVTFNLDLHIAIARKRLTQRALARRLRMDETRLSRIVQGRVTPFPHESAALAAALYTVVADIFRPRRSGRAA